MKRTRRILFPAYLDVRQKDALKNLSEVTRIPMAAYLREAIDDLLQKRAKEIQLTGSKK